MYSRKILARSLLTATVVCCVTSLQRVVYALNHSGSVAGTLRELAPGFSYFYLLAIQAPVLARFFARYPLADRPGRHTLYYSGVGLVSSAVTTACIETAVYVSRPFFASSSMPRNITAQLISGFLLFWIVAGIFQIVEARQRARELEGRLAQAELQNLKSQLQPHFLFNTLHTISVLMRQDVEASNRVLLKLSELLRISLDHNRADQITVQQEIDFLENYLSIEQTRFQERLKVTISAGADACIALIPTLLLQPFVENSIRHGIAPRAAGGSLWVTARRVQDTLELRVEDDGAGLAGDYSERRTRGSGIRNAEERLRALFGSAARMEVAARPGGGVAVIISLSYRREAAK